MRTSSYSDYLEGVTALIGLPIDGLHDQERAWLQAYFTKALRKAWTAANWLDLCPYAEVRFPTNLVVYPNDYTLGDWLLNAITIGPNKFPNPLDGRATASQILEDATDNQHSVYIQFNQPVPKANYVFSAYVKAGGREWVYLDCSLGSLDVLAFFNLRTGELGTLSTLPGVGVSAMQSLANGWYQIKVTLTNSEDLWEIGSMHVGSSPDGVSFSFPGDPILGSFYLWGATIASMNPPGPNQFYIPWQQPGELGIDAVMEVWNTNPNGFLPGARSAYQLTDYGIQFILTNWPSPVYLYYKVECPSSIAVPYAPTSPYLVGRRVIFTDAQGVVNIYTARDTTLPGQSPESFAAKWDLLGIPYVFIQYIIQYAFGDWLAMDGQADKAAGAYLLAKTFLDDELDKQERQMGYVAPIKISTHLTSQNRGLGLGVNQYPPGFIAGPG